MLENLTEEQRSFWQDYLNYSGAEVEEPVAIIAEMAGNAAIADQLLSLYLEGKKTAASGLVADYQHEGDPLPAIGDYWLILDSQGQPRCLVRTIAVETFAFADVPERVARAEGEGDLSLEYWRKGHREFFQPYLAKLGISDLDTAEVVVEHFNVLYPDVG